jgi:lauroyl/myristoyl acyltransferase
MIFGESWLKDLYRKGMWSPGASAIRALPAPWEHRFVRSMGRLSAVVSRRKRAEVVENMRRAFPIDPLPDGRTVEEAAEDAFATHFANQYIGFSFAACDGSSWPRYLCWNGLDRLEAARAQNRGVVLCHPHMGPAQLPLHVLGLLGWPVTQVGGGRVTAVDLSETGRWAADVRSRLESQMPVRLHDGRSYMRPLLRSLRAGEVVMTAMDGTGGGEELGRRVSCSVLGQQLPLPLGPAWLAARSGAVLVPVCCHRNPGDGPLYVAEVGEEIPVGGTNAAFLAEAVERMGAWLDAMLRAHPGDWLFWDGFRPGGLLP